MHRVVQQRRLAPPRVRHDLDVGPRARLQRPRAEQRERPVGVVEQRRAAAQQGPVHVDIGGAEHASRLTGEWRSSGTSSRGTSCCRPAATTSGSSRRAGSTRAPASAPRSPRSSTRRSPRRSQNKGIENLWSHQAEAIHAAWAGPTIVTTGTACGKSLCFQLPTLDVLCRDSRARALYLYPTKALAQDQARALNAFDVKNARLAIYDGDTPREQRRAIRRNSNVVLTNPDMLHLGILPNHPAWANFLSNLAIVVVDEAHVYRGVFGSHVANVLRRLRRIAAAYGTEPRVADGERHDRQPGRARRAPVRPRRLHGDRRDGSPVTQAHDRDVEPAGHRREARHAPLGALRGRRPARRAGHATGARTIVFMKSRKAVELMAKFTQLALEDLGHADLAKRIAPYRAGYTPQQRRELERKLVEGELLGVVSTDALELGIDIGSLDAAICVTFPGTVASLRQQWGRAGRRGRGLAVYVAGEDALDQFFCRHPDEFLDRPVENAILDHENEQIHAAAPAVRRARGPARARRRGVPRPALEDRPRSGSSAPASCASAPAAATSRAGPRSSRPRTSRCARPAATAS